MAIQDVEVEAHMLQQAIGSAEEEEEKLGVRGPVQEEGVAPMDVAKVGEDSDSIFDPDLFTNGSPGRNFGGKYIFVKKKYPSAGSSVGRSMAGWESRGTFTQNSTRENVKTSALCASQTLMSSCRARQNLVMVQILG